MGSIFIFILLALALFLIWIKESGRYVGSDFISWILTFAIVLAFIFY